MYKGSSVSYPRELLCIREKPWINLIPDTWNANSPEDATEPFETQVAFVQPQTAVETFTFHHLQLWQTKDRQKIETEQSHPTRIVRHDLWISVLFSVEKRFAPSQWVPVGPLQIPPRHMLDFSQQGCLAPDKEILIHGDLSGKHRAVQSTRLPASFWVTGRYWVVLEYLTPISVVVFAYAWNQWAGSVATTRAVTHVTLATKKINLNIPQLQQPQPQPPRHSAPSRSSRMVRAQREIAQAFGQFADARGVKLRVGVAMPKPGAGRAGWLCHEKGKEKRWKNPAWKDTQFFFNGSNRKHCSDIQHFIGVDNATRNIHHGIQKWRSKMLQTQNQVKKLNQRFPSSNTFPKRGKQSSPKLQNLVFFFGIENTGKQENPALLSCFACSPSVFLKQGHPFLAVISMGWHSTNFPN